MFGLVLCTAYELSFAMVGFAAAIGTNIAEWYATVMYYITSRSPRHVFCTDILFTLLSDKQTCPLLNFCICKENK